ncbi:hypothetical protein [Effusibacillus consociatus]|uniref:Uncharacterized protein n=1 Tax=Effusibacillus consociatus TaxID=1117041 RepID=A0ABV9PWI9_9BACL
MGLLYELAKIIRQLQYGDERKRWICQKSQERTLQLAPDGPVCGR